MTKKYKNIVTKYTFILLLIDINNRNIPCNTRDKGTNCFLRIPWFRAGASCSLFLNPDVWGSSVYNKKRTESYMSLEGWGPGEK